MQWAGEKTGSLQPTQLEGDFTDLYRRTDDIDDVTKKILSCTESVLQPSSSMCQWWMAIACTSRS